MLRDNDRFARFSVYPSATTSILPCLKPEVLSRADSLNNLLKVFSDMSNFIRQCYIWLHQNFETPV